MTEPEIFLLALLAVLAFWRDEALLYLAAGVAAAYLGFNWWEINPDYGIPVLGFSLICGVKIIKQVWIREVNF